VLIANELIDSRVKSGKAEVVPKLDIEKASTCIMKRMGLGGKWID